MHITCLKSIVCITRETHCFVVWQCIQCRLDVAQSFPNLLHCTTSNLSYPAMSDQEQGFTPSITTNPGIGQYPCHPHFMLLPWSSTSLTHCFSHPSTSSNLYHRYTLGNCSTMPNNLLSSLLRTAMATTTNGVMAPTNKERVHYWCTWVNFCKTTLLDPHFFSNSNQNKVDHLIAIAKFVQQGDAGFGLPVGHQAVQVVLCSISMTFEMAALPNPYYINGHFCHYWQKLDHFIQAYSATDPFPKLNLPFQMTYHIGLLSRHATSPPWPKPELLET